MPKLDEFEEQLSHNDLVYKWLKEHKISYDTISREYVRTLEEEKHINDTRIARYTNLLAQHIEKGKLKNKDMWVKDKTIGTLYCYEDFKNAPIYEDWEEYIEEHNINTDKNTISYEVYNKN